MIFRILTLAGVACASVAPVLAGQCPSGQILRVSKGVCVDRATAIKDGIIGGKTAKRVDLKKPQPAESAEAAIDQTIEKSAPDTAGADKASSSKVAFNAAGATPTMFAALPQPRQKEREINPFGELRLDYFKR